MISEIHYSPFNSEKPSEEKIDSFKIFNTKELGHGGFGRIFLGENIITHQEIAIKTESGKSRTQLYNEAKILSLLKTVKYIPKLIKFIKTRDENYLVMELLGKSIEKQFSAMNRVFTMKTIIQLCLQMVNRIECIHDKGIIHRDVKPDNFLMGIENNASMVYLIDFGLSKEYKDTKTGIHIPFREDKSLVGTARYTSIFTHFGMEQSRRDDIEGLAYSFIYLAKGKLPWQGIRTKNKKEKHNSIFELKLKTSPSELCNDLPCEFEEILKYSRSIQFEDIPNYDYIRSLLSDILTKNHIIANDSYDWMVKSTEVISPKE